MVRFEQAQRGENDINQTPKDRCCLLEIMRKHVAICRVDLREAVLVVGGSQEDVEVLSSCGFKRIVVSNLDGAEVVLDAEEIALPDNSYEVVFAHAVLHHCRSPQKAVGEIVRVSRRHGEQKLDPSRREMGIDSKGVPRRVSAEPAFWAKDLLLVLLTLSCSGISII
jgi:SAM-dependent methyltransferase